MVIKHGYVIVCLLASGCPMLVHRIYGIDSILYIDVASITDSFRKQIDLFFKETVQFPPNVQMFSSFIKSFNCLPFWKCAPLHFRWFGPFENFRPLHLKNTFKRSIEIRLNLKTNDLATCLAITYES